jgi:hypothetical protein
MLTVGGMACSGGGDQTSDKSSSESSATADSVASKVNASGVDFSNVVIPVDSPEELKRDLEEIYSWYPDQASRLDYALRGVSNVVSFSDLGLGSPAKIEMPRVRGDWPVGHSLRLKLDAEMTALTIRFVIDSLPGPRVSGEGYLGIFSIHCDTLFGRDVELPRTQSNTGRLDIMYKFERLMSQINCCDLPPTAQFGSFGNFGDTVSVILTFDRNLTKYLTTIIGPYNGRSYPGRNYCQFRTERGEYHKDQDEFPYVYQCDDPEYVKLFFGSRWRGRKSSQEPILTTSLF